MLAIACLLVGNLVFCVQAYTREYFIRKGFIAARKLHLEEQRSQAVLERMLPLNIIAQLRSGKDFVYKEYSSVCVVLCCVVLCCVVLCCVVFVCLLICSAAAAMCYFLPLMCVCVVCVCVWHVIGFGVVFTHLRL